MKIYGVEIDREKLAEAIVDAEKKSMRCNRLEYLVVLNTESGEMYQTSRPCGDNAVSERIWNGTDRILYVANNQNFGSFRDWFAAGQTEEEIDDWVEELIGKKRATFYYQEAVREEEPMWWLAYTDNYIDFDEAVVDQYGAELTENIDTDAIIDHIEEEANR